MSWPIQRWFENWPIQGNQLPEEGNLRQQVSQDSSLNSSPPGKMKFKYLKRVWHLKDKGVQLCIGGGRWKVRRWMGGRGGDLGNARKKTVFSSCEVFPYQIYFFHNSTFIQIVTSWDVSCVPTSCVIPQPQCPCRHCKCSVFVGCLESQVQQILIFNLLPEIPFLSGQIFSFPPGQTSFLLLNFNRFPNWFLPN